MTMKSSRQFVPIKVLDERLIENDWLPRYEHFGDAGVDLRLLLRTFWAVASGRGAY